MAYFKNFGFEDGTVDDWIKGGGLWNGGSAPEPVQYLPGGSRYDLSHAEISATSSQLDSRTDNHVNTVFDGVHSAMINSAASNYSVSVLSQEIDDFSGTSISFAYAAVLQKSHDTGEADGFSITLTDETTGTVLFAVAYDSGSAQGIFTLSSSDWYYQNWQTVTIDGSALRGHDLTLDVLAYDCAQGGHAGYVYFDGFDLATGKVAGRVFQDYDANGGRDAKEPDLAGWIVYVDGDGDGVRDSGEAVAVTDSHGRYLLEGVAAGEATIRVDVPDGTWEAWATQPLSVEVTEDQTTADVDLAVTGGATPFADALSGVKDVAETIDGLAGDDLITAHGGNDRAFGGSGGDIVRGGDGDDLVDGGAGADKVTGGLGDDNVTGGAGQDLLKGGLGADVFLFSDDFGRDTIRDFTSTDGDKIKIAVAQVDDFSDLVLTAHGDNTIITLIANPKSQIVVGHIAPSALTADDFVFAAAAPLGWHGALFHQPVIPSDLGHGVLA